MVPAVVVTTVSDEAADLPVALAEPVLNAPVLAMAVDVSVLAATAATPRRAVPMAAAEFAVAVALEAPVLPAPVPAMPVVLPVAPEAPSVGPSLSNSMVQNEKRWFTCNLPVYLANTARKYQGQKSDTKLSRKRALGCYFSLCGHWSCLLAYRLTLQNM